MENDDDLGFFSSLQLKDKHSKLDHNSGEKQEIVAGDKSCTIFWPEPACEDDETQPRAAKQAGPCFLQPKNQKLNQRIADAMPWQAVEKAMSRLIDTFFKAGKLPIGLQL